MNNKIKEWRHNISTPTKHQYKIYFYVHYVKKITTKACWLMAHQNKPAINENLHDISPFYWAELVEFEHWFSMIILVENYHFMRHSAKITS